MSDQPETLDKIIAEMHDFCSGWSEDVDVTVKVGLIYGWECRLDAAAERERNAHTNDIHDALYKATGIPGNAAAMREALERIVQICHDLEPLFTPHAIQQHAEASIDAPARNCDRFATELDARLAWKRETKCKGDYRYWIFAPAEGGGHA